MRKFLCLLLVMLMLISCLGLVACNGCSGSGDDGGSEQEQGGGDNPDNPDNPDTPDNPDNPEDNNIFKINGFNNYDEVVAFEYHNIKDGVININEKQDKPDFIKEGNASAEVIIREKVGAQTPTIRLKASNDITDKTDITDVTEFHFSVYNNSDIDFPFEFKVNTNTSICVSHKGTLEKGKWNDITVKVNRDVTYFVGDTISNYELAIVGVQDNKLENAIVLYLDDFYAKVTDEKYDSEKIKEIQSIIDRIINVDKNDKQALLSIKNDYDKLTDEEKLAVYNYDQLFDAFNKTYIEQIRDARAEDPSTLFFFDKEFGIGHIVRTDGGIAEYTYTTEIPEKEKCEVKEDGCLKVTFSEVGEIWTKLIYNKGIYHSENYKSVTFYVYNDSEQDKGIGVNWMGNLPTIPALDKTPIIIKAKQWTKIVLPAKLFETEPANEIEIAGYMDENLSGGHPEGSLYFTSFKSEEYTEEELPVKSICENIDSLVLDNLKDSDSEFVSQIITLYNGLSPKLKDMVINDNYDRLVYATNKVFKSAIKSQRTENPELVFGFGSLYGLGQVLKINDAYTTFDEVKSGLRLDFKGNENWSTLTYDLYDYTINSDDVIVFNIYNDSGKDKGIYINWRGREISNNGKTEYQPYILKANAETTIRVPGAYFIADKIFGDRELNFCNYDEPTSVSSKPTGSLVIKNVCKYKFSENMLKIIEEIENLPEPENITLEEKTKVNNIIAEINALTESEQKTIKANEKLYNKLINVRISLAHLEDPMKVMYFDSDIISDQLKGDFKYVTNVEVGGQTGNYTVVCGNSDIDKDGKVTSDWKQIFFQKPGITKLSDYDEMVLEVYYKADKDIGGNAMFTYFWAGEFILKPNAWNTITVRKGNGWKGFYQGTYPKYHINDLSGLEIDFNISGELYFKSLKVLNYEIDDPTQKVIDDIKNLKPINDLTISDKQSIKDIIAGYNALTLEQKNHIYDVEYNKLQTYMLKIYELEYYEKGVKEDHIVNFGNDYGLYQVYSPDAEYGYSEKYNSGNDGSIYLKGNGQEKADDWKNLVIKYPAISDISCYDRLVIEFYYEKAENGFINDNIFIDWVFPETKIKAGWNHLVFRKSEGWGTLNGYGVNNIEGLDININISGTVYFTNMKLYNGDNIIADLSDSDKYFSGDNGVVKYTPDVKETGKNGSSRIDIDNNGFTAKVNYNAFDTVCFKMADLRIKSDVNGVMTILDKSFNIIGGDWQTISVPVSLLNVDGTISFKMDGDGYIYFSDITGNGTLDTIVDNTSGESITNNWSFYKETKGTKEYSEDYKIVNGKGTMKVTFTGSGENGLVYNTKNNPSGKIVFYVYNDSDNNAYVSLNWQNGSSINIGSRVWVRVVVDSKYFVVDGYHVMLISQPGNEFSGAMYISSFMAEKDNSVEEIMSGVKGIDDKNITDAEVKKIKELKDKYDLLNTEQKKLIPTEVATKLNNLYEFINKMSSYTDENIALDFTNQQSVDKFVTGQLNCKTSYDESVKFNGKGTLKVTNTGETKIGEISILNSLESIKNGCNFEMWVYNNSDENGVINVGWVKDVTITKRAWTKINIPLNQLTKNNVIAVWIPETVEIKGSINFSSVYISERRENQVVVDFGSENGINLNFDKINTDKNVVTGSLGSIKEYNGLKLTFNNAKGEVAVIHKIDVKSLIDNTKTLGIWVYNDTDTKLTFDLNWRQYNVVINPHSWGYMEFLSSQLKIDSFRNFLFTKTGDGGEFSGDVYMLPIVKVN